MDWKKSTKCESAACVEVSMPPGEILVRNSLIPGEVIWFTPEEWRLFIEGAKAGEFDI
jgi:hypothetical protein